MSVVAPSQMAQVRMPITQARHALPEIYASPEIWRLEKQKIFMKEWLLVAREEEIKNAGDYLALRWLDEPFLLVRDKAGTLRAFANVCAHRGVEVAFGKGNTEVFSCPYHSWTYRLDGKLLGAALVGDNTTFDRNNCSLPQIAMGIWGGNVFINFSDSPQPFDEFIGGYKQDFDYLQQENCRLSAKLHVDLSCNWKFAVENLLDIYHVKTLHANTFGKHFNATADQIKLGENGRVGYYHKTAPATPEGKSQFGRMPWLDPELDNSFGGTVRMPPNVHMFARIDQVRYIVVWPTGVDTCQLVCYHLFPEEFFSVPDFEAKAKIYADYQIAVLEEDRLMIDSLQLAMRSKYFKPGPMVKLETAIHHVLNDYLDRMGLALE